MIRVIIINKVTGSKKEYIEEPFTTMRTRMVPYPEEAFCTDIETVIVGSEMGTLVCKHKTGEVFYRNEQLGIDAPMANLVCKREIISCDPVLHWYEYWLRGSGPGCQPAGFVKVDHNQGRWGTVAYERELTPAELDEYEMRRWSE